MNDHQAAELLTMLATIESHLDRLAAAANVGSPRSSLPTLEAQSEFITSGELIELTRAKTVPGQKRWLMDRQIPHRLEFVGALRQRIIVSRLHVREWLAGASRPRGDGFNWDSVR